MALPSKLKNFNLFNDGNNYLGKVSELVPPKLSRKVEEWRGGGMDTGVEVDMGGDLLIMEWTAGGLLREALAQFGATSATANGLRFAGAYQRDDDGGVDAVEIVVRGRHKEIDMGTAKPGDTTAHKYTTTCSYYRLDINGSTVIEIDAINMIFNVDGVDRLAEQRRAIGI
jgi:P2 family phage contractile tail tube protein